MRASLVIYHAQLADIQLRCYRNTNKLLFSVYPPSLLYPDLFTRPSPPPHPSVPPLSRVWLRLRSHSQNSRKAFRHIHGKTSSFFFFVTATSRHIHIQCTSFSCNPKHRISAHNTAPDGLAFLNPSPVVSPKFKLDVNGSPSSAHQRRTRGLLMHCCDCFIRAKGAPSLAERVPFRCNFVKVNGVNFVKLAPACSPRAFKFRLLS
ncbi:hypothetical protein CEXT_87591 [Caerostris extrusa]|uniref:Uncharacterized protein n=1 Tax=Caerostris extrusa TaxID=172846 RepID=A0AAV4Y285_CAEEX|nr:hypothetical protein CEXT_87591 [Caerostris extrusa]